MKDFWNSLNKLYFFNFVIIGITIFSISFTFFTQFKVEALQDEIGLAEMQISTYKDQIKLLEVEWTYLTRPERLRVLANKYLKDNGYTLANQIKNSDALEKYYVVNYEKSESQKLALNAENHGIESVSF
jgi:hypothetical protein